MFDPIRQHIMKPPAAFADVRVLTTLLVTLFAAGACRDYDSIQPATPEIATLAVTLDAPVIEVGQETGAAVTAADQYGNAVKPRTLTWTSSAPNVATIDPDRGVIRGVALGTARITATVEGQRTADQIITVINAPARAVGVANPNASE